MEGDKKRNSRVGVSFGVRGIDLNPAEITNILGISSTNQFAKGDAFDSRTGKKRRRFGIWVLDSESVIDSEDVEKHADYVLNLIESSASQIHDMLSRNDLRVSVAIWWEPEDGQGGFTLNSNTVARLSALSNEIDFYFT